MKTTLLATLAIAMVLGTNLIGCSTTTTTASSTDSSATPSVGDTKANPCAAKANPCAAAKNTAMAVRRTGQFVAAEHPTSGTVTVVTENGKTFVEFDSSFATDSGPDLYVVLHKAPDVLAVTKAPAHSINEGDYVSLGALQTIKGAQRYEVPAGVNVADFNSALIWCQQFNATFGTASLN